MVDLDLYRTISTTDLLLVSLYFGQLGILRPHNSRSACAQVRGWLVSLEARASIFPSTMA